MQVEQAKTAEESDLGLRDRMDRTGLMSTVPRELRELYYDVVVCPDLESQGRMKHRSHSSNSRVLDTTSLVYKADLRIPKAIGPLTTYEEQRIANSDWRWAGRLLHAYDLAWK